MLKTRLINAVFAVAIITGVVVMLFLILPRLWKLTSSSSAPSTPVILQQVQSLSDLVTVKYVMEKVIVHDDGSIWNNLPLGANNVILVAHGIVKAGINLGDVKAEDINITDKKIAIKLPPARVTDAYLDDKKTLVVDYNKGILRSFDKDLEQNAREQAVLDINRAARQAGIEKDASDRAKDLLKSLFGKLGYKVEFQTP